MPTNTSNSTMASQVQLTVKKRPRAQLSLIETGNQGKNSVNREFDADSCRLLFVKMIAKHDLDLNMVNHAYFREYVKSLNPFAADLVLDVSTVREDVLELYSKLKLELQECFDSLTSKCSLSIDMWTIENPVNSYDGYCCVNCHYIDDDWTLHKKVIGYVPLSFPYTGEVLAEVVKSVVLEWSIDDKLFVLAADNDVSNDVMIGNIKEWLNDKGSLVLEGDLFQMQCSNQIFHLIAQKGLEVAAAGLIVKIRECVEYSQSRKEKFERALMQVELTQQVIHLDEEMRWESTFLMLKSATELREGFVHLAKLDSGFKCLPNSDEWEQVMNICECLKVLYDITAKFAWERHPTTTMYFKLYDVNKNIRTWESSTHKYIREMALEMRGVFDKYWRTCSLLMSVRVVLDPRYKVHLVKFVFLKLYGEDLSKTYISNFRQTLNNIFSSYESQSGSSSPDYFGNSFAGGLGSANLENNKVTLGADLDYAEFLMEYGNDVVRKTELEQYLEEPVLPKGADESKFDVLSWWKNRGPMYPTLAKMARDILAVPVSTLSSQSAFDAGDRVLTGHRSHLCPEIFQALSCLKSWLP